MEVIDLTGEDSPQVRVNSRDGNRSRRSGGRSMAPQVLDFQSQPDDVVEFVKEVAPSHSRGNRSRTRRRNSDSPVVIVGSSSGRNTNNNDNNNTNTIISSVPQQLSVPEENPLICPICFDKFDCPSTTPCGHIFCSKCLMDCLNRNPICPKCRAKVSKKKVLRVYLG